MKALVELVLQFKLVEKSLVVAEAVAVAVVPWLKEKNGEEDLNDMLMVLVEVAVQDYHLVMLVVLQMVQLQETKHLVV